MKRIVVVGGGFAGLAAARQLAAAGLPVRLCLVDQRRSSDFLPLLPDVVARRVRAGSATAQLDVLCAQMGVEYLRGHVKGFDGNGTLTLRSGTLDYDYLVVACGSQTAFYDRQELRSVCHKLDSVSEAVTLADVADRDDGPVLVVGGGYTGIEVASQLRERCRRKGRQRPVMLVLRGSRILRSLPAWLQRYTLSNLERMGVCLLKQQTVTSVEEDTVTLSGGETFEHAVVVWTAGVRVPDLETDDGVEKDEQGRLIVDDYLRVEERVFAAGDAACFRAGGRPLRMSVQHAITQGCIAARNVVNLVRGRPLRPLRALDLGYVVPMANYRSCGVAMGLPVRGLPASALHYVMSAYRSQTWTNRMRVLHDVLRPPEE